MDTARFVQRGPVQLGGGDEAGAFGRPGLLKQLNGFGQRRMDGLFGFGTADEEESRNAG